MRKSGPPPPGQRSIASFFGARPSAANAGTAVATGKAAEIDAVPVKATAAMDVDASAAAETTTPATLKAMATTTAAAAAPRPKKEERAVRPPPAKKAKRSSPSAAAAPQKKATEDDDEEDVVAVGGRKRPTRAAAAAARKRAVICDDTEDEDDEDDDDDSEDDTSASDFSEADAQEEDDDDDDDDDESEEEEDETEDEPSPPPKKKTTSSRPAAPPRPSAAAAATAKATPASFAAAKKPVAPFASTPATPAAAALDFNTTSNTNNDNADVARYSARDAERFPFLQPGNVRDSSGLRPGEINYSPRTLRIPPGWFKAAKITEAQRQWWELKAANFDSVLLFKMGKFYEMFEMDAHVGADVLGLQYMRGEQPHCGFPEASYSPYAEKLARAGKRVVVIEQTETPAALAARNEERKKRGLTKVNVVNRDVVSVLTVGTLTDPEMLSSMPDAANVLAVVEFVSPNDNDDNGENDDDEDDSTASTVLGAACFDAATGRVSVGGWRDSASRPRLRALLAELRPVEVVVPRGSGSVAVPASSRVSPVPRTSLAPATKRALFVASGNSTMRINELDAPAEAGAALDAVDAAFASTSLSSSSRPALVSCLASSSSSSSIEANAALAALASAAAFLRDCRLDRAVLGLRRLERLPCADAPSALEAERATAAAAELGESTSSTTSLHLSPFHESLPPLAIDGAALDALEVLANGSGGAAGTLLSALDFCVSPPGRRRLRGWLCRPLGCPRAISKRQDAVEALLGPARAAADSARASLAGCGDLERSLARLSSAAGAAAAAASAGAGASGLILGRDSENVVLYEDAAKRRVLALAGALRGLRLALDALGEVASLPDADSGGGDAGVLRCLSKSPLLASADAALRELENAADWRAAAEAGRVSPAHRGADAAVDAADDALGAADEALERHLQEERSNLKCRSASFVSLNKDTHVLEVPDATTVPSSYSLVAQRKGFRRYMSPKLRELVAARDEALQQRETALSGVLKGLLARFGARSTAWAAVGDAAATLDALLSLAAAAEAGGAFGPMCRPVVLPPVKKTTQTTPTDENENYSPSPFFRAVALRHPAAEALLLSSAAGGSFASSTFVPNDVTLGDGGRGEGGGGGEKDVDGGKTKTPPFVLLTGPNMGGKSTLLRQVCLAALAAHAGAWVPAASLELTAVDAVFVRAGGARDAMLAGASTFLVELQEAAAPLLRGTVNSLVALDELGRGTATADGAAIAGAVLDALALKTRCRGLFATHYHSLSGGGDGSGGRGDDDSSPSSLSSSSSGLAVARGGALPMHMSCRVDDDGDKDDSSSLPRVTFLYKLVCGACPKSYGTNVARLAGLPEPVVARAAALAAELEEEGGGGGEVGKGGGDAPIPSSPSDLPEHLAELVMRVAAASAGRGGSVKDALEATRAVLAGI